MLLGKNKKVPPEHYEFTEVWQMKEAYFHHFNNNKKKTSNYHPPAWWIPVGLLNAVCYKNDEYYKHLQKEKLQDIEFFLLLKSITWLFEETRHQMVTATAYNYNQWQERILVTTSKTCNRTSINSFLLPQTQKLRVSQLQSLPSWEEEGIDGGIDHTQLLLW